MVNKTGDFFTKFAWKAADAFGCRWVDKLREMRILAIVWK